jgi:hypothetical protein
MTDGKYRDEICPGGNRRYRVDAAAEAGPAEAVRDEGIRELFWDLHINAGHHGYTISSYSPHG